MREYELAVILHPDLEIDLAPALSKIEEVISEAGGKIEVKDEWGKHKLAYQIGGQGYGIYNFYRLQLDPAKVADLERSLKLHNEVLRHLLIKAPAIPSTEDTLTKPETDVTATSKSPAKPAMPTVRHAVKASVAEEPEAKTNQKSATKVK